MRYFTLGHKLKLGDTWAFVSWMLQQDDVALTQETRSGRKNEILKSFVIEIASLFDTSASIAFIPGKGGQRPPAQECVEHPFLPTRLRWTAGSSREICVQLDGRWMAHRKNPKPEEVESLVSGLRAAGFTVRIIGLPMTLAESVEALSACYCFVGVDSGMMYVANSVGCPRILIRNRMFGIDATYRGKAILVTESAESALKLLTAREPR